MTTAFTETLNLCIDYHDDSLPVGPIADPHNASPSVPRGERGCGTHWASPVVI